MLLQEAEGGCREIFLERGPQIATAEKASHERQRKLSLHGRLGEYWEHVEAISRLRGERPCRNAVQQWAASVTVFVFVCQCPCHALHPRHPNEALHTSRGQRR
ncbi:hypothetical protein HRR83_009074 [Exophiala dermatitidis]|uniref:Uncharacterized protein n=1 Tax=Exophiala dermatitidis TaxID=5970 RepID=A0AAN6EMJ1_EXODE|nr:hypothetical protein HRR73_009185 [Exophiala dermatitidis]KAJ4508247.1 hypothetical protein HRR74_007646 [Exophiala dermatitidis]KAJ4533249.1 hypothetical protein HRR77_008781 [Exophiala dermatitidis]KAJ4540161.1 hypothetical protein HRR76_003577 [Exophiala dermatitidis]KAJ4556865.1 hypothetical protein HRR79_008858 [Exophiala dermatitidis]